jgi:hypothetical protein
MPAPDQSEVGANKNTWVEQQPAPPKPSPMQSVSDGARRVRERTRAAWGKTVDALTPGDQSTGEDRSSRVARRDGQSAWKRMFGASEPAKKEGSQTVGEFIAQERLDP